MPDLPDSSFGNCQAMPDHQPEIAILFPFSYFCLSE
jgi:hypothetical protein